MFIAIYGINNIGKSTQIDLLEEELKNMGKTVKTLKYPIYDLEPTGSQINYFLRNPDAPRISGESFQMLYIQNRLAYEDSLKKHIDEFDIVLAEDYIGTGMAWGMTQGVPYKWLQSKYMQYPQKKADLEILLDGERFLEGKESQHRNEDDDLAISTTRNNFLWLAKKYKWQIVHANQSQEKVTHDLMQILLNTI